MRSHTAARLTHKRRSSSLIPDPTCTYTPPAQAGANSLAEDDRGRTACDILLHEARGDRPGPYPPPALHDDTAATVEDEAKEELLDVLLKVSHRSTPPSPSHYGYYYGDRAKGHESAEGDSDDDADSAASMVCSLSDRTLPGTPPFSQQSHYFNNGRGRTYGKGHSYPSGSGGPWPSYPSPPSSPHFPDSPLPDRYRQQQCHGGAHSSSLRYVAPARAGLPRGPVQPPSLRMAELAQLKADLYGWTPIHRACAKVRVRAPTPRACHPYGLHPSCN